MKRAAVQGAAAEFYNGVSAVLHVLESNARLGDAGEGLRPMLPPERNRRMELL